MNVTKTPEQVRAEFAAAGVSISAWAKANKFGRMTVVGLLCGHLKGLRGEAHRAAIALGLKRGRVVNVSGFKPAPRRAA